MLRDPYKAIKVPQSTDFVCYFSWSQLLALELSAKPSDDSIIILQPYTKIGKVMEARSPTMLP